MDTHFSAQSGPGTGWCHRQYSSAILLIGAFLLAAMGAVAQAPQPLAVSTIAGAANFGSADGAAPAAKFLFTSGVAVDGAGNVYVADTAANTIRKVSASGVVTTIAGTPQVSGTNNGTGSAALFNQPYGVAVDAGGNVYVADTTNCVIRKIATNGAVTTVAGKFGVAGYLDGSTNLAAFNRPYGIAVDAATNIYVADTFDNLIRKISGGTVTTIAGDNNTNHLHFGTNYGNIDGTNFNARFTIPIAIAVDKSTNLYVADYGNNTIRRISPSGTNWIVTTLAGNTNYAGTTNGVGTNATFGGPTGIAVDSLTNIYVADETNHLIRLVAFTNGNWTVTTFAGETNAFGAGFFGNLDGFSLDSLFYNPWGIAVDSSANVYVGDSGNGVIREIAPDTNLNLVVSTIAGPAQSASLVDSADPARSRFNFPNGVALDSSSNIYVADSSNNCIRQITAAGVVTIAGSVSGVSGTNDGANNNAAFSFPAGLCVDANTNIYVADYGNSTIRMISPSLSTNGFTNWNTTTIAGQAENPGYSDNGVATNALFSGPVAVTIDPSSNIYVADYAANVVRIVTNAGAGGVATFVPTNQGLNSPNSLVWSSAANELYVADTGNAQVVAFDSGGNFVGSLNSFESPDGIAVDASGNVYVADSSENAILGMNSSLKPFSLTNIAGTNGLTGSADGVNMAAQFDQPIGLAVDASSNVYIADSLNNTIRKGVPLFAGVNAVLTADTSPSGLPISVNGTNYDAGPQIIALPLNSSVTAVVAQTVTSATDLATNTFVFANWLSNNVNVASSTNFTFTLTSNISIVAKYVPQYAVAVSASPGIGGTVGGGGLYASNSAVTVVATNSIGYVFTNWTQGGKIVATTTNYSFTATGDVTLVANFVPAYSLTVSASPAGGGTFTPGGTIVSNTLVTVIATNNPSFVFSNWTSNGVVVAATTNFPFNIVTNVAMVANFTPLYSFTTSASPVGGGTVTKSGTNLSGTSITVIATNNANFAFVNWTSNGVNVASTTNFTFTLATNVNIIANFVPTYAISVSASPVIGGTVGGGGTFNSNAPVTVIATNNPNFAFVNWTSNGVVVSTSTNYSFNAGGNASLVATFVPTYTVGVSASPGADGTVTGAGTYNSNTLVQVSASTNTGFAFVNWTSNGVQVATTTNYSFTIRTNLNLVANFVPAYVLGVSASPGADGTVTGAGTYASNTLVQVTASTNTGFAFVDWTSNGVTVATTTIYSFLITTNLNLQANFVPAYVVSASASPGADGTVTGAGTYSSNALVTVNARTNSGFAFVNWTSNGLQVATTTNYSFNVSANVTLVANFVPAYIVGVTASPGADGTVGGAGTYSSNTLVTVTAMTNAGFAFINWTSNGFAVSTSTNYSFNVSASVNLVANFLPLFGYTVSASPSGDGTVTPSGTNISGTSVTVIATNNPGFVFTNWTSNGVFVGTNASYTFTLNTNTALVANFLPLFGYTVSASPSADGTVSASGTNVTGTLVTVVATNNSGFAFVNWSSNGVTTVSTTNYTFTLNTNVTVTANFVPAYPVAASVAPAGSGMVGGTGFIAGNGTFPSNTSVTLVATNNTGYVFTNWTSNGVQVATTTNYTFTLSTNVTLVANFLPLFPVNVSVSPSGSGTASHTLTNSLGSSVTVIATNNPGYVFTNWSSNGITVASTTNFTFTLVTNVNMVANFLPLFTDSVSISPAGSGTASPGGTNALGTLITVVATNNPNYVFTNWTSNGVPVATTTNFSFNIATNVTLVANFLPLFPYTVSASPSGSGTVSQGGTNVIGTSVTVIATNNPGFVFTNWTSNGVFVSTNTNYTFTLNTNAVLVANFLPLFAYNVSASPGADGTVSASGTNVIGTVITVIATNNPNFAFVNWSSNGVTTASTTNYTFTLTTNVNLAANFVPTYNLTVNASPAAGGTFSAGGTYNSNTLVTVVATNNPGYIFTNWTSNSVAVSSSTNYSFNISTNLTLTANFNLTPQQIAVSTNGAALTNNQTNVVSFGTVQINQPDPTVTFTVSNLGGLPLTISNITVPPEFLLTNAASATLTNLPEAIPGLTNSPVTNGTFTVALLTTNLGVYSGTVVITNDDTNFSFPISGSVMSPAPVIRVIEGGSNILNGQAGPVNFGSVPLNQPVLTQVFTITNPGLLALAISNITVPAGYTLSANAPTNVPATNSATFSVQLDTTAPGVFGGNISISNGDTNRNPFVFPVTGKVTVKTIALSGNLSFGVITANSSANNTLTISNSGNTNLTVSSISYPAGFSGAFTGVIPPGGSHAVTVTFTPTSAAAFGGTVTVNSDATGGVNTIGASGFGANSNLFLVVITNGSGTVAPILTSKALVAGKKYTLTATAKTGSVFSNWSGSINTNKSPLTFVMEPGTILEANFIPNPFLPVKGSYNGLFTATNGNVDEATAGMLKGLTIGTKGTYSGTLMINGASHGLSGTFNLAGQATNKVTRPASQGGNLLVLLNIVTSSNSLPIVTGSIYGTNNGVPWVSTNLVADLASNIPFSSEYTVTIPPDTNNPLSNSIPGGDGYALITNHTGALKITGALADGTAFSQSVPVSQSGDVPVYMSLYANKGLLLGWINLDASNAPGSLAWVHPTVRTGLFTTAFTCTNLINLSSWTNPPASANLPTKLTVLEMSSGAITQSNAFVIVVSNNFKIGEVSGPLPLSGSLNPKTGQVELVIGSKADKQTVNGAVLLNQTNGGGFFVTKTNSGAILLK